MVLRMKRRSRWVRPECYVFLIGGLIKGKMWYCLWDNPPMIQILSKQ